MTVGKRFASDSDREGFIFGTRKLALGALRAINEALLSGKASEPSWMAEARKAGWGPL